jgi:hypothetical protein
VEELPEPPGDLLRLLSLAALVLAARALRHAGPTRSARPCPPAQRASISPRSSASLPPTSGGSGIPSPPP